MFVVESIGVAEGFETLTTATAIGFTSALIAPSSGNHSGKKAKGALISCETAAIRFTLDSTTPTVTAGTGVGHTLASGSSYHIKGIANVAGFRCINETGGSGATVKCTFFF